MDLAIFIVFEEGDMGETVYEGFGVLVPEPSSPALLLTTLIAAAALRRSD